MSARLPPRPPARRRPRSARCRGSRPAPASVASRAPPPGRGSRRCASAVGRARGARRSGPPSRVRVLVGRRPGRDVRDRRLGGEQRLGVRRLAGPDAAGDQDSSSGPPVSRALGRSGSRSGFAADRAARRPAPLAPGGGLRPGGDARSSDGCTPTAGAPGRLHVARAGRRRGAVGVGRRCAAPRHAWSPRPRPGRCSAAARWTARQRPSQDLLAAGRLADARERLTHLVGRDTTRLDEARGRPRRRRVARREHLRRRRRSAGLGRAGGRAGPARLPRRQHPGRDGRPPQRALRALRLGRGPARRPAQPARLAPDGRARRAARRRSRRRAARPGGGTPASTRARTPGRSRRRSRARWAYASAAPTPTAAASSSRAELGDGRPPGQSRHLPRHRLAGGRSGAAVVAVAHRAATHRRAASTSLTVGTPRGGAERRTTTTGTPSSAAPASSARCSRRRSPW